MASLEELRNERKRKLERLRASGIDPYPIEVSQNISLEEVVFDFDSLVKKEEKINVVGRVMALRTHGGSTFLDIFDGTARLQIFLAKDQLGEDPYLFFIETVDVGDFVEASGTLFATKRGEKTLGAESIVIITKSIRPLPEKWHGLQDIEERFRRRYLDILMNKDVSLRFRIRQGLISELRRILDKEGFLEVETPLLQEEAGGATAIPFSTFHEALGMKLYLRIAPELFLKRLLVAGFPKVYEIGRNFRNEGIDHTHNPEFTMLEYYRAYGNAKEEMAHIEKYLKALVKKVLHTTDINYQGKKISFSKKFKVISYETLLKEGALIANPFSASVDELILKATQYGVTVPPHASSEALLDAIYKKVCRPKLIEPTFVTDYPANYLPLAKRKTDIKHIVDAFQLVVGGLEVIKAFSELNDPLDQEERFAEQEKRKKGGEEEVQRMDQEFLEALEYGMPPASGVGIGIDRLAMLFTDTNNIKEVILFPTMRPRQ